MGPDFRVHNSKTLLMRGEKKVKRCPITGQPEMKSWGIGRGIPPLTDDPENPLKPFAEYEMEEGDEVRGGKKPGMRKKFSPNSGGR